MKHWLRVFSTARFQVLFLAVFLPLWTTNAFANPDAEAGAQSSEAASPAKAESESDKFRANFDALRELRLSRLRDIADMEIDAQTAVGDDQIALRGQALEWTLEGADTFEEMWALIEEQEASEGGASTQKQSQTLIRLLPGLQGFLESDYDRLTAERATLKIDQVGESDPDAATALGLTIDRLEATLLRILGAGINVVVLSDAVGRASDADHSLRAWLEGRIEGRGRLAVSHVRLAQRRQEDVANREGLSADPAAFQAAEAAAKGRTQLALENLELVVDLMERLDLETASYRQLLVASTGEITVDAIDAEVAGELFSRWTSDVQEGVADNGARLVFQLLVFVVIVSAFWGLSRFVRKIVARAVEAPHLRFSQLLKRMLVSLSSGAVLVLGLLIALSQLGIEIAPMLAGLGIAGFVLGFALQDTLGNFASGVMILLYRPYDVGDMIDCAGGVFGQVSQMSLVSTTVLTIDNKTLVVPNSKIWGDVITNVSAQAIRRVDLEFGIGYGDDIPHAEEVLWSIIKDHPKVLEDPEPVVKVHSLGDSSVNFVVRPWVASDDYWDVHWDFMREVKLRFDREGVSIPFPQRDVHFYSAESAAVANDDPRAQDAESMEVGSTAKSATDEPEEDE
jgi:small conductance mechanosensitive channel